MMTSLPLMLMLGEIAVTPAALAACSERWLLQCLRRHESTLASFMGVLSRSRVVSEYPIDAVEVWGSTSVLIITEGDPRKTNVLLPSEYK